MYKSKGALGMTAAGVALLPQTGEISTNIFLYFGILILVILVPFRFYTSYRKYQQNNKRR